MGDSGVLDIPTCLCGSLMVVLEKFGDIFVCPNCDLFHKGVTPEDKVRDKATREQYNRWFPDQPTNLKQGGL